MPTFEVCFKVGDSNPSNHDQTKNWEDGQVIATNGPGLWWTTAEWETWRDGHPINDTPPGFTSELEPHERAPYRRMRLKHRRFLNPAFTPLFHINQRFGTNFTQSELDNRVTGSILDKHNDECIEIRTQIQGEIDRIVTHGGLDTNWGYADLSKHSVVSINATPKQMRRIDGEAHDETHNVFAKRRAFARRALLIDYTTFMSAPEIAAVQDQNVLVNVDRVSVPETFAAATIPITRDLVNNPEGPGNGDNPS